jgi:alkylhydroperoxidase family enzyme
MMAARFPYLDREQVPPDVQAVYDKMKKFAALADYTTNPLFSDLERLVIRYAEEMTEKVQVDSHLVEELKQQLGPEALVQLTLSIAAANFTNRFNEALGTELET